MGLILISVVLMFLITVFLVVYFVTRQQELNYSSMWSLAFTLLFMTLLVGVSAQSTTECEQQLIGSTFDNSTNSYTYSYTEVCTTYGGSVVSNFIKYFNIFLWLCTISTFGYILKISFDMMVGGKKRA